MTLQGILESLRGWMMVGFVLAIIGTVWVVGQTRSMEDKLLEGVPPAPEYLLRRAAMSDADAAFPDAGATRASVAEP